MIYSQYFVGVPVLATGFLAAMKFFGGLADPGAAIQVHSLMFTNDPAPSIVQDRTVYAKSALYAGWSATITAKGNPICKGSGSWPYTSGHKVPKIPINEWVGDNECWDKLPEGVTLQACAKYIWGDGESTEACSLGFRKGELNG